MSNIKIAIYPVAIIAYRDATAGGELRAAAFKGLREAE
jgi:hypothetical protein